MLKQMAWSKAMHFGIEPRSRKVNIELNIYIYVNVLHNIHHGGSKGLGKPRHSMLELAPGAIKIFEILQPFLERGEPTSSNVTDYIPCFFTRANPICQERFEATEPSICTVRLGQQHGGRLFDAVFQSVVRWCSLGASHLQARTPWAAET